VELVANPAVTGDNVGAAFFVVLGDNQIEDAIERRDLAVDAASALEIDQRVRGGIEDIARRDDVRMAEKYYAGAACMRCRLVDHVYGFLVEVQLLLALDVRLCRPGCRRRG